MKTATLMLKASEVREDPQNVLMLFNGISAAWITNSIHAEAIVVRGQHESRRNLHQSDLIS